MLLTLIFILGNLFPIKMLIKLFKIVLGWADLLEEGHDHYWARVQHKRSLGSFPADTRPAANNSEEQGIIRLVSFGGHANVNN